MKKKINFQLVYRIIFAFFAWFGVIGYFITTTLNRPPERTALVQIIRTASYFTIQSNIFVAIWFTFAILYSKRDHPLLSPKVKGACTLYITFTGIIYALILRTTWNPQGFDLFLARVTHYVTPVAFILDWFLYEKRQSYQWNYILYWFIYPLCYLVYTQIYGWITGKYLYFFINVEKLGWGGVALNVVGLCVCFLVFSGIYIGINKKLKELTQEKT